MVADPGLTVVSVPGGSLRRVSVSSPHPVDSSRIDDLRSAMIAVMRDHGFLQSERVEQAFRAVPRHLFAPEVSLGAAYDAEDVVRTKFDEHGATLSSVSAPYIQAMMLEQADIHPGHQVLEIGSGGYNAALIAELVGTGGQVTTVDIDPDIVDRARRCLAAAGYRNVTVDGADAEDGLPRNRVYDRVIVTAGAWDIPPSWTEKIAEHGRLVVPLRLRGLSRSVALERTDDHWASVDHQMCGFVPMQGRGAHRENSIWLHDDVSLRLDDDLPIDTEGLGAAVLEPPVERFSGVEVASNEPFDGLHLWLITALSHVGRFSVEQRAIDNGLLARMACWSFVAIDGASFAYHAGFRSNTDNTRHEFVVHAHGPEAARLAGDYTNLIRIWNRSYRDQQPGLEVHPSTAAIAAGPASRVIDKEHIRIALHWSDPARG